MSQTFLAAAAECAEGGAFADATFAARQIQQLPFFFRVGVFVLAAVFQFEFFFRAKGRFASLPVDARRKQWAAWQQSQMRAKRDFVALCAGLMAFSRFSRLDDNDE